MYSYSKDTSSASDRLLSIQSSEMPLYPLVGFAGKTLTSNNAHTDQGVLIKSNIAGTGTLTVLYPL
jgi:hypothetical protein